MNKKLNTTEENKLFLKMNLQFFAEGGDGESNTDTDTDKPDETGTDGEKEQVDNKPQVQFTQADIDRAISKTAEKVKAKYERKMAQQQKLSGLDEKEREIEEAKNRAAELEEELKRYQVLEQKAEVTKVLNARGLPIDFADLITLSDDNKQNLQMIDKLDAVVKKIVKAEVAKRIGSNTPKGSQSAEETITKEQFNKMTVLEQQKVYAEQPELYKQLTKR